MSTTDSDILRTVDATPHLQELLADPTPLDVAMDRMLDAMQRRVKTREHTGPAFRCEHCKQLVRDGLGYLAFIIEPDESLLEVDRKFCGEQCAEDEARTVRIDGR